MRPLSGIRVLDFSRLLPGPMCSWYLRGMGAEVIKLESPTGGDPFRHFPPLDENGVGVGFSALNAGTRSVALNLRTPEGLAAARALIGSVDVVVEGFRPGVMARLGLDPAELVETWPGLIVVSISGFGQTGSWRDRPGHDLGYMGLSGLLSMNADSSGPPRPMSAQVADVGGGALTGALAIVGALLERERTGEGRWVDISMTEGALAFGVPWFANANFDGHSPNSAEHPLGGGLPQYRCYSCKDDEVLTVAALEPKFLMDLCARMERPFPSQEREWEELFRERTREEWLTLLEGCCVTPVLDFTELADHELHRERGSIVVHDGHPRIRPPVGSCRDFVLEEAPDLGADTARELAGLGIEWKQTEGET